MLNLTKKAAFLFVIALLVMPMAFATDYTTGLIHYYSMDSGNVTGGSIIDLVSPTNTTNYGDLVGDSTAVSGYTNEAISFDGSGDGITFTDVVFDGDFDGANKEFTIHALINATGTTGYIFYPKRSARLQWGKAAGTNQFYLGGNTLAQTIYYDTGSSGYHLHTITKVLNTISVYVDGVYKNGTSGDFDTLGATNGNSTIGYTMPEGAPYLTGNIDEFVIYNDNQTAGRIADMNTFFYTNKCGFYDLAAGTCGGGGETPAYAHLSIKDLYDNSSVTDGTTCYMGEATNTSVSGVCYFYNQTTGLNYSVSSPLYFSKTGTATENATTNVYTYGAFPEIQAFNLLNQSINTFNATSGGQKNTTTGGNLHLLLAPNTSNSITIDALDYLQKVGSITTTGQDTGSYNLTGLYQSLIKLNATYIFDDSQITNFTINYTGTTNGTTSTTNGTAYIEALDGNYTFTIDATGYAIANKTIEVNSSSHNYEFPLYTTNSILFGFYDIDDGKLINFTNISIEIDGGLGEYETSNGTLYIDLITPATYHMAFAAAGYVDNFYIFSITDRTTQAVNLTMLNISNSDEVTLYVYDKLGNKLEGAIIKILRYDSGNNSFTLVSTLQTNIEGLVETSLTKDTQYYKFIIDYDNETRYTSVPTYIYGTTLSFYIDISGDALVPTFDYGQINGAISFNQATRVATFTYSDTDNVATQGCFYAYSTALSLLNSTCVSSSSGTLYLPTSNTTTSWYLEGKVTKGGITYLISTYRKDYAATLPETTGLGLFLGFIVFGVIIFIGIWSLEVAVALGSAVPLLLTIMGLTSIGYIISVPVLILGLIAAFIIGGSK